MQLKNLAGCLPAQKNCKYDLINATHQDRLISADITNVIAVRLVTASRITEGRAVASGTTPQTGRQWQSHPTEFSNTPLALGEHHCKSVCNCSMVARGGCPAKTIQFRNPRNQCDEECWNPVRQNEENKRGQKSTM